jgi:thiol-disulfide isomerase/thioredoxin
MLNMNLGPFAVQVSHVLLLLALLVAAAVGHFVGRPHKQGITKVLVDMVLVALLASRMVFVGLWFDTYRQTPWGILDIRDGGFTPWAGWLAGLAVAIWHGRRNAQLRRPLSLGLVAGILAWDLSGAPGMTSLNSLPVGALTTLAGESTHLAALAQGQPMVVNLWATWCPPCRSEMPVLAAAQKQESGLRFVFVNQGEDGSTVRHYLGASGLDLANVVTDPGAGIGHEIGSSALPTTMFYDSSGRLVDIHQGALSAAALASRLSQLRPATTRVPKE